MSEKSWVGLPSGSQVVYKPIKLTLAAAGESKMFSGCCVVAGCVIDGPRGGSDRVVRMWLTLEHAKQLSGELLEAIKEAEAAKKVGS